MQPLYDLEAVKPMEDELNNVGVKPLKSPEEVEEFLNQPGTAMIVINSVCGCAAGSARPGVTRALQNNVIPDHLATVFAGMDRLAVEKARSFMSDVMPSSPCVAIFKDGEPVYVMERRHIETKNDMQVSQELIKAFNELCTAHGPSIPAEEYEKLVSVRQCGSSIPLYGE